jgi:MerR family transcriptional regulator, copper efflux regulator
MKDRMRIGELAELAGVTPRTVRYYEGLGLLGPSEREGRGFRYYTDAELARLRKIDALKKLGLSLEEIAGVIDLYFNDATALQGKQRVLEILEEHLRETEATLAQLGQFRGELRDNIARYRRLVEEAHGS